ncbi:MAG: electron transfer flavoprotein subunit alpha/FixB family protein [Flavobacteriales bacterium]|nr:electron transfer flavoprotein subunit alpha/FixB family protein [Flavobacteriales bacterium]
MSTIVFIDTRGEKLPKAAQEAVTYASQLAGGPVTAVTFGDAQGLEALGANGAAKVVVARAVKTVDSQQLTKLVSSVVEATGSTTIVCVSDATGKAVAPRVAARLKAGHVAGATGLPEGGRFRRNVFSGKARAFVEVSSPVRVVSLSPNSVPITTGGAPASVEEFAGDLGTSRVTVKELRKAGAGIPLPEAERVVSGGRGMKGAENWGPIEELARELGAATACSRPVADDHWRPHHEHVGQTGVAIRPDLYIAIGISGAIQHLAGVNQSKVICVINKDPEAPFFKAADYGIVGDAFEVLPQLIAAAKKLNAER